MDNLKVSAELLNDWMAKKGHYDDLIGEYFAVHSVVPGRPMEWGKLITPEIMDEIDLAEREAQEAEQAYFEALGLHQPRP